MYRSLRQCVDDLRENGHLVVVDAPVDARLEVAEIQRRVFAAGGPAVFFSNVASCAFPMVSNLFGTMERIRFIFRDTLDGLRRLIALKADPRRLLRHPGEAWRALPSAWAARPKPVRTGPVLTHQTTIDRLPQLVSWPDDGGAYVTLPIVYSEDVEKPGMDGSNLGMYRVQLSGGTFQPNEQVGLHYQIHRGLGIHHAAAIERGVPLPVNVFVGGTPAMTVAAVMPLPEGLSELTFAGPLAGYRIPMIVRAGRLPIYAEADFCITGRIEPDHVAPEGPFGDHLGYYSLAHDFPVMKVDRVYHREGAIWPFTVVGRPPQEDTMFGRLIHELTGPVVPSVVPGVHAVHAVDAAGVHPLMLAVGSERYTPYEPRSRPRELLTQANAILGQGQMSLAKYLLIVARDDDPELHVGDVARFLKHVLCRVDWQRDLHFQTRTTIDTLDYSGTGLNEGSKLVIAATGPAVRELPVRQAGDVTLPAGFSDPHVCLPGVLAIRGPTYRPAGADGAGDTRIERFCTECARRPALRSFPLIVIVDDAHFTARSLSDFLWVTFTRSNPAADVYGIEPVLHAKHWGCAGPLVIDARTKPHHAPPLLEDPEVTRRVDAMATRGGPLAKYL